MVRPLESPSSFDRSTCPPASTWSPGGRTTDISSALRRTQGRSDDRLSPSSPADGRQATRLCAFNSTLARRRTLRTCPLPDLGAEASNPAGSRSWAPATKDRIGSTKGLSTRDLYRASAASTNVCDVARAGSEPNAQASAAHDMCASSGSVPAPRGTRATAETHLDST